MKENDDKMKDEVRMVIMKMSRAREERHERVWRKGLK
jgi:hypothetical protein